MSLFSSIMRVASVAMGGAEQQHFPYVQGTPINQSINQNSDHICLWKMFEGAHESTGEKVTIFVFDKQSHSPSSSLTVNQSASLCRNAIQKLKTLRHPHVLKYVDSIESTNQLMVATEPCVPFSYSFKPSINEAINQSINPSSPVKPSSQPTNYAEQLMGLGLHQMTSLISWLNNDCKLVHGSINTQSIYQSMSGEFRLFGFEIAYKFGDISNNPSANPTANQPINLSTLTPQIRQLFCPSIYRSPELSKYQSINQFVECETSTSSPVPCHYLDAWSFGVLMFDLYSGGTLQSINQLTNRSILPAPLQDPYKKLLSQNPSFRLNPKALLDNEYFKESPSTSIKQSINHATLIQSINFLSELAIKNGEDKEKFFERFSKICDRFPQTINQYKILPILVSALDHFGSSSAAFPNILGSVLKISSTLSQAEYQSMVLPVVTKLFAANDRLVRVNLLTNIELFASHLSEQLINQSIFTHVLTGFSDSQPILREVTVKSMPHFIGKLNSANQTILIGWLTKLQSDPEPAIRTNTTYCIAKLASHFDSDTRDKVCIPAFSRALRDPAFPPARMAGLVSFTATSQFFGAHSAAKKILPQVFPLCVDDQKEVREQALKCVQIYMTKIQQFHDNDGVDTHSTTQSSKSINANDPVAAASTLLANMSSWAVSSFKFGGMGQGAQSTNASPSHSTQPSISHSNTSSTFASASTPLSNNPPVTKQASNSSANQSINSSNRSAVADDIVNPIHSSNQTLDAAGWGEDFDIDELAHQSDDDDFGMSALSTKKKSSSASSSKKLPIKSTKKDKKPAIIQNNNDDSDDGFDDAPNDAFDNWDSFDTSSKSTKPDTATFDPLSSPTSSNPIPKRKSILSSPPNASIKPVVKPVIKPGVKSNGKKDDWADFLND